MKPRLKVALFSTFLASFQFVSAPQLSSAATSYLSASTYYAYESFTSSGTWNRPFGVTQVDYLVVAGGGRGGGSQYAGHFAGGGGGGGGVRSGTTAVSQTSYTITVGAGQSVGCSQDRGGSSSIAGSDLTTISATGGGSGSCNSNSGGVTILAGYSGGSGGGGGAQVGAGTFGTGNAGGYVPSEGNDGGAPRSDSTYYENQGGGGGGGAGAAGATATTACAGKGGNGISSSITGTAVTYAGGGGGGTRGNSCGGGGGTGGGGTGGLNGLQGTAGTDGLGGGGGGTSLANGNRGGNGVVIIRFLVSNPDTPNLPTASDTGNSNTDDITSLTSFALTGNAIGGSTIQIYDGANPIGSPCTANLSTGAYSCSLTSVSAGTHTFTAKASFNGGAAATSTGSLTVVVDATAPTLSPVAAISIAENQTAIRTVSCNESCTLVMSSGVDSPTVTFTPSTGTLVFKNAPDFEAPSDANADRIYAITIQGTDTAGNVGTTNYQITITNLNESSTLGVPSISGIAYKGISTNLSVTSNVAGRVRFYFDGKRIANCLAIPTTGSYPNYTATCPWKPTVTSRHIVSASLTPSDGSFSASISPGTPLFIQKRTGTR